MLKVPFEQFLVKLLCQFIDDSHEQSLKFHFESTDPHRARALYNSFFYNADNISSLIIDGAPINAITTDRNHRLLVMLHRDGEQSFDTYNEDFITNIRDELNKLDNTNLVVIHNSSLDTILTSFQNLNAKGQIFTPESIKEALINLIVSHDHPHLMQILLSYREKKIVEENLSIFAYEYLYNSIINNTVDFTNEGLFRDSRLLNLTNKKEIEGDIKDNAFLYNVIDRYVTDFSNSEVELKEKLEEIGLGEKFIKEHFFDRAQPLKWKKLEYRCLVDEIDENKHRLLDVENIEYNGKTLTTYKHGADTGAKYKKISVIIETDSADVELKIRMTKGDPLLRSEQIRVSGDYCESQINLRAANHEKQTTLTASFTFDGNPKFFKIKFDRPSVKENFQFNILVVKKATFNFHRYFEKVTIDFERNKGKVLLENIVEPISISAKNTIEHVVKQVDEIINFEIVGTINLQQLLENEVSTTLTFLHNNIQLPVSVTGSVTLDSIKLPSILDAQRSMTIFEAERIPKYNAKTKRVIVAGKEKALNVDAQILCSIEYEIVHQGLLTWHENQEPKLIQNLATCYPAVTLAYQDLFAWLQKNETILSITNWSADLIKCVHNVVQAVIDALEQIPNGSLTSEQRELLDIGIYKGTMNKQEGAYEWLTPYHPLCLSYALELANKLTTTNDQSISQIPSITLNKLTPAGLLPILVDDKQEYSFTEAHSYNKLWLKIIPQKQNNPSFVEELVSEKIKDFTSCFEMIFKQNQYAPLIVNSIYNQDNEFIFKGIVDYLEKNKSDAKYIHVNIYDDNLYFTFFDQFSESKDINQLKNIIKLSRNKQDFTDEFIALIREKVSYSKFINKTDYAYAHLSFFKNNEKVKVMNRSTLDAKTGITCQGFISGEASYLENNNYYTGFGLRALQEKNNLIQLAEKYNELLIPYKNKSASYIKGVIPALVVHDKFKEKLTHSYDSSIWTCIIDPKVTLDFFDDANTILIHYSDHYTNSSSYDAITVSSRVSLYKSLLNKESDELLNSFNAISGQWLLEIVKASGKKNSDATTKQIKEKQGIIAAYKFLASFLLKSNITWVPLPVAELIRVTGSLGLGVKDNDFSARLHNKRLGVMCDDILFVGFANNDLYLLPLEVKNREKGTDFTKAVEQAKELGKYMKELLAAPTFKGQIYRSLFIQHVISQIERFQLYNVFPADYFTSIILSREVYQQGDYQISEIKNYPLGIALALNNNKETAKLEVKLDEPSNILQIQLPLGLSEYLQGQTIVNLADELTDIAQYPELKNYILTNYKSNPVIINDNSELKTAPSIIEQIKSEEFSITTDETYLNDNDNPLVLFDYPYIYQKFIDLLLEKLGDNLTKNKLLSLTEIDLINLLGDNVDLLTFFRLKEYLIQQDEKKDASNNSSPKLINLNIDKEFSALIKLLIQRLGDTISVDEVLSLEDNTLLQLSGFGPTKLEKFAKLKKYLKQHKFSLKNAAVIEKAPLIEDFDIAIDELEKQLILSLETFLSSAKEREKDIFQKRFGIYCDSLTLEEIGSNYSLTRERVRQIEVKAKINFLSYLTVSQKVIQAIIKSNLSELREPLFCSLRAYFKHDKNFYSFIELCCGLHENEIKQIINPKISQHYFNEFWINHTSPASLDDLTWYLHETLNIEQAVAENQILRWSESDLLTLDNKQFISPKKLPKVEALTNALLEFSKGSSWKCIQQRVIDKKITLAEITSERLDPALTASVDKEYIYQSGRGTYCHLNYLQLSFDEIDLVLTRIKEKMKEYQFEGRSAVNLSVDVYQKLNFPQDYFIIRHIVRAYGPNMGIYFNGKSGTDTISLNAEFDLVSQRTVLIEFFKRAIHPLTKRDIADKIRSQSLGHAAFYLDILLNEGEVVRISETEFAHKDNVFNNINIDNIMALVGELFNSEDRIIEGEILQTYLNRKLDLQFNKYFYLSLLKTYAEKYKLTLYFVQNLIAKHPIKQSGLADFCREALTRTPSISEAIKLVQQCVLAHDHIIRRALLQNSLQQAKEIKPKVEHLTNDNQIECEEDVSLPTKGIDKLPVASNLVENTRVLLGKSVDTFEDIYWEYGNKNLANRHLIVFGRSGQGKTYCIQGILMELAKNNHNSLVIDYTNGFLPERLEVEFNKFIQPTLHYLAQKPLGISPFRKHKQDYGGVVLEEQNHIVATRIASVFNQVYSSIGEQQFAILANTIENGLKLHGSDYNFNHLYNDLIAGEKRGEVLANKLSPMIKSNLFDASKEQSWENIFSNEQSRTTIIQLVLLSRDIMQLATEFSLWDLYAYACSYGNKNKPLPIVLDEVQNLDHKLDSPLGKMLTEGRKYGISLILATQTLSVLKNEEQDRLFQAAHKLFFAPAETESMSYAKLLEQTIPGTDRKMWLKELANLQKGECISVGLHKDRYGNISTNARTIKVADLESRLL